MCRSRGEKPCGYRPEPGIRSTGALRRRSAIVGTGHRASMYVGAILGEHADHAELVALVEPDPQRVEAHLRRVAEAGAPSPSA